MLLVSASWKGLVAKCVLSIKQQLSELALFRELLGRFCLDFAQVSSPHWQNMEQREAYQRLIETVSVLRRLATRLSSRAEIVGAVRQVHLTRTRAGLRKCRTARRRQGD